MDFSACVVIVSYNSAEYTISCIRSIIATCSNICAIIVVDNSENSGDYNFLFSEFKAQGSRITKVGAEALDLRSSKISHLDVVQGHFFPDIFLCASVQNLGFAFGCNLGAHIGDHFELGNCFWFLNPDTVVENDVVSTFKDCIVSEQLSFSGDFCLGGAVKEGVEDVRTGYSGTFDTLFGSVGRLELGNKEPQRTFLVKFPLGSNFIVSRSAFMKMGGLCEHYFLYYEEIDFTLRFLKAGGKIIFCHDAIVRHLEGKSIGTSKSTKGRSALSETYGVAGRLILFYKFFPWRLGLAGLFTTAILSKRLINADFYLLAAVGRGIFIFVKHVYHAENHPKVTLL